MTRHDAQTANIPPGALPFHNTAPNPSRPVNTPSPTFSPPFQFSDEAQSTPATSPLWPTDPRYLLAIMTQTRHQCRPNGLIKRDYTELTHIAKTQGLSKAHAQQIIQLVQSSTTLSDHQLTTLATIPINPIQKTVQKKTRIPIRVLVGLSIWAITIVIAMQMV